MGIDTFIYFQYWFLTTLYEVLKMGIDTFISRVPTHQFILELLTKTPRLATLVLARYSCE